MIWKRITDIAFTTSSSTSTTTNDNTKNNNLVSLFKYQQWVAYNRWALEMYVTKVWLRLELELDWNTKIMKLIRIKRRKIYPQGRC
jgi:hypothetical protein